LWSLLSAPLLIGCDLDRADAFTISLLTNDEVLAVSQDELGKEATRIAEQGDEIKITGRWPYTNHDVSHSQHPGQIWAKPLADGSLAVGLFNLSEKEMPVTANFSDLKITGPHVVRDLWRQKDVATVSDKYEATVEPHGVVLVKITAAK